MELELDATFIRRRKGKRKGANAGAHLETSGALASHDGDLCAAMDCCSGPDITDAEYQVCLSSPNQYFPKLPPPPSLATPGRPPRGGGS